jgi:hypothetical protein
MRRTITPWIVGLVLVVGTPAAHGQLFEADSKRYGNPKMDIVLKEVERRQHSSVVEVTVASVGSSVGSSFFILCSVRQLAQLRGNYRYIVKLEDRPKRGQMLVGFLRGPGETLSDIDPEFARLDAREAILDLDQFAEICDLAK